MDKYLQLLRKKAASGDPEAINQYVHKLEQLLGFTSEIETEKKVYVLWNYANDFENFGPFEVAINDEDLRAAIIEFLNLNDFDLEEHTEFNVEQLSNQQLVDLYNESVNGWGGALLIYTHHF